MWAGHVDKAYYLRSRVSPLAVDVRCVKERLTVETGSAEMGAVLKVSKITAVSIICCISSVLLCVQRGSERRSGPTPMVLQRPRCKLAEYSICAARDP